MKLCRCIHIHENQKIMISILVKSLPLKEVLEDIAFALDVPVTRKCDEYTVQLPFQIGKGFIRGMDFKNGLGIIFYDCFFHQDTQFNFIVDKTHPVKFLYCEKGQLIHRFEKEHVEHKVEEYENAIVASTANNGHIFNFKGGMRICLNSLEMNREVFSKQFNCEIKNISDDLSFLFQDKKATKEFYYHGKYCLEMADLFDDLQKKTNSDLSQKLVWNGGALQLLNLQILQYQDKEIDIVLRKIELKQVIKAVSIINKNILDFTTVPQLAREVGLTALKLQEGFKYLYNTTVNEYVIERRLDLAKTLLEKSDHNISEIVDLIGLSSRSYFSRIFKNKYNISPSAFLKLKKGKQKS